MWNDVSETLADFINEGKLPEPVRNIPEHHIRHFVLWMVIIFFGMELIGFFFPPVAQFMDHQASVAIVTFGVHTAHSWFELIGIYHERKAKQRAAEHAKHHPWLHPPFAIRHHQKVHNPQPINDDE